MDESLINLRVVSLETHHPHARGSEINFRFETAEGEVLDLSAFTRTGVESIRDGEGGNGEFLKLTAGVDVDYRVPANLSLAFLSHPWSGHAEIYIDGRLQKLDLFAPNFWVRRVSLGMCAQVMPNLSVGRSMHFPEALIDASDVLAVCCPRWRGVAASTQSLFQNLYLLPAQRDRSPDSLNRGEIQHAAETIAQRRVNTLVLSGGDHAYLDLAHIVRGLAPNIKIYLLWHGSFLQCGEAHDLKILARWMTAAQNGEIDGIGVVKRGLDAYLRSMGIMSFYIENSAGAVKIDPSRLGAVADTMEGSVVPRVGVWLSSSSSYRKPPHAMLAAMRLLQEKGVRVSASGLGEVGFALSQALGVGGWEYLDVREIDRAVLYRRMAQMSVNLYVTISECSPMLPLESWSVGAPCLIGPSCKLYDDDEILRNRLVVTDAASPAEIYDKALYAIEHRVELMTRLDSLMARAREHAHAELESLFASRPAAASNGASIAEPSGQSESPAPVSVPIDPSPEEAPCATDDAAEVTELAISSPQQKNTLRKYNFGLRWGS